MDLPGQNELKALLEARDLVPKKPLGQNFLIDKNILRHIAALAELGPGDLALEVGAGPGTLTQLLCESAGHVLSVEIDRGMHALSSERLAGFGNLTLVCADALQRKSELNREVTALMTRLRGEFPALKFVANLPYAIATPLMLNWMTTITGWERMVLTVQKEVADKMRAPASAPDYGGVSVLASLCAKVEIDRLLPNQVFWPQPAVQSAMIVLTPALHPDLEFSDLPALQQLVRSWFAYRRKTLAKALKLSEYPDSRKDAMLEALTASGVDLTRRGESFSPDDILAAFKTLQSAGLV